MQHLDLADASLDTVVSTYAPCTVPDPRVTLLEAGHVLSGHLLLVEHGPSQPAWLGTVHMRSTR